MKLLILLALTWKFSCSINAFKFCDIGDYGDELLLRCNDERFERIHSIEDESVSCGQTVVPMGDIKYIRIEECNEIESIRKEPLNLPNLRSVKLFHSNLTMFGATFKGSHQLTQLNIKSPMISLPLGLFRYMDQLEILLLTCNEISNWGANDFEGLGKLKWLYVKTKDDFPYVNETWNIPKSLRYLVLLGNGIRDNDSMVFPQLHDLILLHLELKRMERVDANSFSGLTNLRSLSLTRNDISRIENGAFIKLNSLKRLDLSRNRLTALDENTFKGLSSLQYLSLKFNRISDIAVNTFSALTSLIQLDLSFQDGLVTIDLNAFPQFIDLQTKTVLYTAISSEPDDLEQKEVQWLVEDLDLSEIRSRNKTEIYLELFGRFELNQYRDHQIDLHNLTQHMRDRSLILGNLDLSVNEIISINVENSHYLKN